MNSELPKYVGPKPMDRLMTRDEIKSRFDNETASAYSQEDPVYLPDYASTFELLMDCVLTEKRPGMSVLDLGAGTGNLSLRLLRRDAGCHVTLVDFSQNMLTAVTEVLGAYEGRYDMVCDDFTRVEFKENAFDAVISSFAIHHTRSAPEYVELYRKIHSWLKPGGMFACYDVVNGSSDVWTRINEDGWREYLSHVFDKEKIDHIFANYHAEDSPLSVPEHPDSLRSAGFSQADVLWKRYNFALYCARKGAIA